MADRDSIDEIIKYLNDEKKGDEYPWNKIKCYSFEDSLEDIEKFVVLCRNSFDVFYLKNKIGINSAVPIEGAESDELAMSELVGAIYDLTQKDVDKFVEVFSCTKVVFEGKNRCIDYLSDKLCKAGCKCIVKNNDMPMKIILKMFDDEIKCSVVRIVLNIIYLVKKLCDIDDFEVNKEYLFSMVEEYYCDSICCRELVKVNFIKDVSSKLGYTIEKILLERFEEASKDKENLKLIEFTDVFVFLGKALKYACQKSIIKRLKEFTNNVYCLVMKNSEKLNKSDNRTVNIYLRGYCSDEFIDDILYESKYDLVDIVKSRHDIEINKICIGYTKYESNYKSKCFSTNLYGDIRVESVCDDYIGKVFLIGPCTIAGYAVADSENVPSFLQAEILEKGFKYRVINFGVVGCYAIDLYKRLLDVKIDSHDIIIIDTDYIYMPNENNICLDFCEIDKKMSGKSWYWDAPEHFSAYASKIIAGEIMEQLNLKKKQKSEFPKAFKLEGKKQIELDAYLLRIKNSIIREKNWNNYNSIGAIVMNCNPFTYGHKYLIETASRLVDGLLVFVVEEDKSFFAFKDRLQMVKDGIKDLKNAVVLPSGNFMISTVTFAGYFQKENPNTASYDNFYDLKIFSEYIAPALKIKRRFVGEEPVDKVTSQYNKDMKVLLKQNDIDVIEIPRLKIDDTVVNATFVRKCLESNEWEKIAKYVPDTTLRILKKMQK